MLIQGNDFSGSLPEELFNVVTLEAIAMNSVGPHHNNLAGSLPDAIGRLTEIGAIYCSFTHMGGAIPGFLFGLPDLQILELQHNQFNGPLPDAIAKLTYFPILEFHNNQLSGSIPDGIGELTNLMQWHIPYNRIRGSLPDAIRGLRKLTTLVCAINQMAGTLPGNGSLAALVDMQIIGLSFNMFSGSLPDQISSFTVLKVLMAHSCSFSGSLPSALETSPLLRVVVLADQRSSGFEGSLPALLGWQATKLDTIDISRAGRLEGLIPSAVGRMRYDPDWSTTRTGLSSGFDAGVIVLAPQHALQGKLPSFKSTVLFLSLYENRIEGSMPSLRLVTADNPDIQSHIFLHNNELSCRIPKHHKARLPRGNCLVLLGNMLSCSGHLRRWTVFPAWVNDDEKSELFVVSNYHGQSILLRILWGISLCWVVATYKKSRVSGRRLLLRWIGSRECLRWIYSSSYRVLLMLGVVLGPLLALYANTPTAPICMPVLTRLQVPSTGIDTRSQLFAAFTWMVCCRFSSKVTEVADLHWMTLKNKQRLAARSEPNSTEPGCNFAVAATPAIWTVWIFLVLCMTLPSSVHNVAKAVPGFLGTSTQPSMTHALFVWVLTTAVSLLHQLMIFFLAPSLANVLHKQISRSVTKIDLLCWARLLSLWLVPALVLAIFHPHCLQAWTLLWRNCRDDDNLTLREYFEIPGVPHIDSLWTMQSREDICRPLQPKALLSLRAWHAIIEHSVQLLMYGYVQSSFIVPVLHALAGQSIKCTRASVTVWSLWEVLVVFGVCAPALLPLLAATAFSQHYVLFCAPYTLLDRDANFVEKLGSPQSARICTLVSAFAAIAFLLQANNIYRWALTVAVWMLGQRRPRSLLMEHSSA